jgi:hypothetical protein
MVRVAHLLLIATVETSMPDMTIVTLEQRQKGVSFSLASIVKSQISCWLVARHRINDR